MGELLHSDGWQLTTLVLLIISAKQWDSDYPISTSDVCSQNWALGGSATATQHKGPVFCARRVNDTERRVLKMLDYCTVVSQAEFARYYLTLPFTFPSARDDKSAAPVSASASALPDLKGGLPDASGRLAAKCVSYGSVPRGIDLSSQ